MATIAQMLVALGVDNSAFKRGLGQARDELGRFVKQVDQAEREATTFARASGVVEKGVIAMTAAAGAFVTANLAVAIKSATGPALEFGRAMAEVSTLLDDTSSIPQLTKSVKDLAQSFGQAPSAEVAALYQIISAGATNAAEATSVLTAANKLAVAGVTDIRTAADGLTTILNAYGPAAGSAADVSDALFVAMRAGKTTIGQLASSISTVAPLAAQAGASLTDVLAAVSALSKGGVKTEVAMTGLRAVLAAIVKPSDDAVKLSKQLGIQYDAAGLKAKGLGGFLQDLKTKTGGNVEVLAKLAGGVEALTPILALTGTQAKDLSAIMETMANKSGQTATALAKVAATPAQQFAILHQKLAVVALDLGTKLLNAILPALIAINKGFSTVVAVVSAVTKAILLAGAGFLAFKAILIGVKIAETVTAFLALIPAINGAAGAMTLLGFATKGMLVTLGPIGIAIAAIGTLAAVIYASGQKSKDAQEQVTKWAAALATLNDEQVRNIQIGLKKQLVAAELAFQTANAAAKQALVDASQSRFDVTPHVDLTAVTKAKEQVDQLRALLKTTNEDLAGRGAQAAAQQRIKAEMEALAASLQTTLGGALADTRTAFDRYRDSILATLDTLDVLKQRQATVGDFAGGLADAFDAARVALEQVENRITDQRAVTGQVDSQLVALANTIRQRIKAATDDAFKPLIDGARDAIQRASLAAQTGASSFVQAQALDDLKARYRAVISAIDAEGGALKAPLALLQEQLELVNAIHERSAGMFGKIDQVALDRVVDKIEKATEAMLDARFDALSLEEALEGIAGVADGFLRVADALGGIGDNARQAIQGVVQLADSLRQVQQAKTESGAFDALKALPGIAGAIAAGASILSGVLGIGESADQRAMKETIQQNSKRLKELRDGLDQFQLNASATLGAGQTARSVLTDRDFLRQLQQANQQTLFLPGALHPEDLLDQKLREIGSNFQQLNAIAKSLGITLETTEGDISIQALQDLMDAAGITAESLTRLSNTFDVASRAADLRARLTGDTGELAQLQRDLMLFQNFAPQLSASFGAIDTATQQGRDQLRAAILHLLDSIKAGTLTPEQLGQFQNADQLLDVLDEITTALDAIPVKLTQFGDTLDQQRAKLDLKARLFGQDSPAAAVQRELDLLAQLAPELGKQFQGLDAVTADGREAIRTALQHLFTTIEQGLLTEGALGQLEGIDDLLSIISNTETALDSFTDATNAATASLRNVPEGFKLALRTFQSSFAEMAMPAPQQPVTTTAPAPASPPPIFDPGRVPTATYTFAPGSIVIEGTDLTADEIFDAVSAAARRKALSLYGDAERAAETL